MLRLPLGKTQLMNLHPPNPSTFIPHIGVFSKRRKCVFEINLHVNKISLVIYLVQISTPLAAILALTELIENSNGESSSCMGRDH